MSVLGGQLDLGIPGVVLAAMLISVLQPLYLLVLTRARVLADRNALQFLLSAVIAVAVWIGTTTLIPSFRWSGIAEGAVGLMALGGGMLIYLEIWGLMSRGYTLALLLTIHRAGRPLSASEIRNGYRGGEGLEWIMRHRLGAMISAGVIERESDRVVLTPVCGLFVARLHRFSAAALGLRRTG